MYDKHELVMERHTFNQLPKRIISQGKCGGVVLFKTNEDRASQVAMMIDFCGYNYFTYYVDANEEFRYGLSYGFANWVADGSVYKNR
jgi:hypothetical protein